jgi:hypothetical protein
MHLPASHKSSRLPKRFPVGTTYVVEGHSGQDGHLLVFSRYVVLPGGQRINVGGDFNGSASAGSRRRLRDRGENHVQTREKHSLDRGKKILAAGGTTRQHRR